MTWATQPGRRVLRIQGNPVLSAVLPEPARRLASDPNVGLRRRVGLWRVYQVRASVHRVGDAIWIVCVSLSKRLGTADAADDRQRAGACDHCP